MLDRESTAPVVCTHQSTDRRQIKSEFFKREFTAEVDVCRKCGQRLWTPDTQGRFNEWIVRLKQERRDVFQLQFYVPESARHGLNEALERLPGVAPSVLIRVMVTVYLASHVRYPEFKDVLKRIGDRPEYQKYAYGRRRKTSVQFSPMALLDIQSWAAMLKLSPSRIVEDAIFKFLALQNDVDAGLRDFWEKNLWPQIEIILRAV